jgi:L-aspartate oxidase
VTPQTKAALWELAGLRRDAAGLQRLGGDPNPIARAIAAAALAREETRGVHCREDHPQSDPALELMHGVLRADGTQHLERWL